MGTQLALPGIDPHQPPPAPAEVVLTILGTRGLVGDIVREGGWFIPRGEQGSLGSHHGTLASALDALIRQYLVRGTSSEGNHPD